MRVAADTRQLDVDPGGTTALVLDVVNTATVIDGVSARVIGLPEALVSAQPALLPLFPDSSGQMTVSLAVPPSLPAGRHQLTVEVVSHGARLPSQFVDVDLDVASRSGLRVAARPRVVRARRGGRFVLELSNDGNVPLDVSLTAADADRAVTAEFVPPTVRLEPGAVAPVLLNVRGPRLFTGAEIDRSLTVQVDGRPALGRPDDEEPAPPLLRETTVRLRQRPLVSRGLLTALILVGIIALWAVAFLLGLTKVFSGDAMTKQAPASFFLGDGGGAAGGGGAPGGGGAAGGAPAGALPKTGQVAPGTGGSISGTVVGKTDQQPVGRILVQAWRKTRTGFQPVSSAATQSDGTYTVGGLFPTSYYLEFSSSGFDTVWYPGVPGRAGATAVPTNPQADHPKIDVVIAGHPATMRGKVTSPDAVGDVPTQVVARPLYGDPPHPVVAHAVTDGSGNYVLPRLPAPGTYQLTFTSNGYRTSTLVDSVTGGGNRYEPTVVMGAGTAAITGAITDGTGPLGGATVTTTMNGKPLAVSTPTVGTVGSYVLGNLQTPGTYVLTFSAPGHGSVTRIVQLQPGSATTRLDVVLRDGTGSINGHVDDGTTKAGLGGVQVSIGGGSGTTQPSTTTLTSGQIGDFGISNLAAPAVYELTFSKTGYRSETVRVTLTSDGGPGTVAVDLTQNLGRITGTVRGPDGPYVGATVTATDGSKTWTAKSTSGGTGVANGGFLITGLPFGTYSVTVSAPGMAQQTGLVTLDGGHTSHRLDLALAPTGG